MRHRLLLCTDMDRTVIPNGVQAESKQARVRFAHLCQQPDICLVYVTGRHKALVQEAIAAYDLPAPRFAITDVGTTIYEICDGHWQVLAAWHDEIKTDWGGRGHAQIKQTLIDIAQLSLQEDSKQNDYKLSYYLPLALDEKTVLSEIRRCLIKHDIDANLVWSIDEEKSVALLDVLPPKASKLHAIEFLQRYLHYQQHEVVFAGDSGNDLAVLESDIAAVLVANATQEIKQEAERLAAAANNRSALYIATGEALSMNGHYSAGVLEGIWHFCPEFRALIESSGR